MRDSDVSLDLQWRVEQAVADKKPLRIIGGNSKSFLGRDIFADDFDVSEHAGIVDYDPRELVVTARCGTLLTEIESVLATANQMLPFEPPHFGAYATLGGTLACGLSGPRRPYSGSARDHTLGCSILNGRAQILRFGGRVMKNVAGFDLSRLTVGAYGTTGLMLEVSMKVLPRPVATVTLVFECDQENAIRKMSGLLSQAFPVDAAGFYDDRCYIRLSGSRQSVKESRNELGGDVLSGAEEFWSSVRELRLGIFSSASPLYRIMVKPATPPLHMEGDWLLDWGGAQRWFSSSLAIDIIREEVKAVGGHVTIFRGGDRNAEIFPSPSPALLEIQQRIKRSFDPHGIFNPGRLFAEI